MIAAERETTVTVTDADEYVTIWSARRKDITRLRRNDQVEEVKSGFHGSQEWAQFRVPADRWSPVSGVKRKVVMTPEQRAIKAERMREMRAK